MKKSKYGSSQEDRYDIGADEYRVLFESTMDVLIVYDPQSEKFLILVWFNSSELCSEKISPEFYSGV